MVSIVLKRTQEQTLRARDIAISKGLPELIYEDFLTYAKFMRPTWTSSNLAWQWFHVEICNNYQKLINGELSILQVEMPPQHAKTLLMGLFATYCFGLNPNLKIIYATYNEDRAIEVTGSNVYQYMNSDEYRLIFPHVVFKMDVTNDKKATGQQKLFNKQSKATDRSFTIQNSSGKPYNGSWTAIGMAQGQHGKSGDIYLIDDYVAQSKRIQSEEFRVALNNWFFVDVCSRLQPNFIMGISCTRWYFNDIIGTLHNILPIITQDLKKIGAREVLTKSLRYRAEFREDDEPNPNDPRKTNGEPLWFDKAMEYFFAKNNPLEKEYYEAMYNCDPTDTDSTHQIRATDFGYYDVLPDTGTDYFCIDGASTTNKKSDKTAIGLWRIVGVKRYLVKIWYLKLEIPQLIKFVANLLNDYPYHKCLIEFANSGVALSQSLETEYKLHGIIKLGFSGRPIDEKNNTADSIILRSNSKMSRYERIIPEFSYPDKRIMLPNFKIEHLDEFIRQMTSFNGDNGKADDLVDMATYLIYFTKNNISKGATFIRSNDVYAKNNLTHNNKNAYNTGVGIFSQNRTGYFR